MVWLIAMLPFITQPIAPAQGLRGSETASSCPFWWRQGYDGSVEVSPELQVAARRLDGEGSVSTSPRATGAKHEDFGGWAMLVGLEFPTAGCWQVTGQYRLETLSFVVEVGE